MEQLMERAAAKLSQRKRVETVVEALGALPGAVETPTALMHDARNMVTAIELYCDLLEEPGVLAAEFAHYGSELKLVAAASRRLLEKLGAFHVGENSDQGALGMWGTRPPADAARERLNRLRQIRPVLAEPIASLAAEVSSAANLLAALAGPSITLTVEIHGGALPVSLTREDLTRVLVNLVKNAAEAMPQGGRIAVGLDEFHSGAGVASWLVLTVEDSGPGIPAGVLEKVFESGFTTRSGSGQEMSPAARPGSRRGLGLSISRGVVEAAGGRIHAANRLHSGARLEIELPVR